MPLPEAPSPMKARLSMKKNCLLAGAIAALTACAWAQDASDAPHKQQLQDKAKYDTIVTDDAAEALEIDKQAQIAAPQVKAAEPRIDDDFIVFGYVFVESTTYHY